MLLSPLNSLGSVPQSAVVTAVACGACAAITGACTGMFQINRGGNGDGDSEGDGGCCQNACTSATSGGGDGTGA